jgi:hypothetical protein
MKEITEEQIIGAIDYMAEGWSPKVAAAKAGIQWPKHRYTLLKDNRLIEALWKYNHTRDHKTKLYPLPKMKG